MMRDGAVESREYGSTEPCIERRIIEILRPTLVQTLGELQELADKIEGDVWRAQNRLQALVYDAIPPAFK